METGFLRKVFAAAHDKFHKFCFHASRFTYDHGFLELEESLARSETGKACIRAYSSTKRVAQESLYKLLFQKSISGEFAPKPWASTAASLITEGQMLLRPALPVLHKYASSPSFAFTTAALVGCFFLNDANISMIAEQLNQLAAIAKNYTDSLPQSDNPKPNTFKTATSRNTISWHI